MKPELESKLEDRCVARIEALGGRAPKLVIRGVRGFPDRTMLLPGGIVFFIEFKRQRSGVVSAQQAVWRRMLVELGFAVYVIDNDADFERALAQETKRAPKN